MTFSPYGKSLFGKPADPFGRGALAKRFVMPPFTILSARDGDWQDRKRAWIALGIQSELGRGEAKDGRPLLYLGQSKLNEIMAQKSGTGFISGTSIFDPVLCELLYRWFCPRHGHVLDPFAGGSVRGIVASLLGRRYTGVDLSVAQIESNREQAVAICGKAKHRPVWIEGDAMDICKLVSCESPADFILTCPPYGNLERYSDDPRDLSTMKYNVFIRAYAKIIRRSCKRLAPDRFACFIVGEFRTAGGGLAGLVLDTIAAFEEAGLTYYNDAILVTQAGSLPVRVGKQFQAGRKLGRSHQNVLVFVKGDPRAAAQAAEPV